MKQWFINHNCEWLYRGVRTFLQAAIGVIAAAIVNALNSGVDINWERVIAVAVATGLGVLMNISPSGSDQIESDIGGNEDEFSK